MEPQSQLNNEFFQRLGTDPDTDKKLELASDSLKNILTKEIKFKDLNTKLLNAKQETVTVKEIVLESDIEFINSLKKLKSIFRDELKTAMDRVNDLYQSEVLKLKKIYKSEIVGDVLLNIVKTISPNGWILLMKDSGVFAYKHYSPPLAIVEGCSAEKGVIKEYEEPVCSLKAIYVNVLHPHITYGTILLSTDGQHPNCDKSNFGEACVGDLDERDIPLDGPEKLLELLNEISATYERIHLDSAYYTPTINVINTRKDEKWKATGT